MPPKSLILLKKLTAFSPPHQPRLKSLQSQVARQLMLRAAAELLPGVGNHVDVMETTPPSLSYTGDSNAPLSISISHSGIWTGCMAALADAPIGFDFELHKSRQFSALLDYLLDENETRVLRSSVPIEEEEQFFYRCWTIKEALGKLSQQGWSAPSHILNLVNASQNSLCFYSYWPEEAMTCAYALAASSLVQPPPLVFIVKDNDELSPLSLNFSGWSVPPSASHQFA